MNDDKEDDNPWDEEGGGRTVATSSPSFDSNIPSPITDPPPPISTSPTIPRPVGAVRGMSPNKPLPKATLVGLNPADFIKPRGGSQPRLPSQGSAAVAPRFPTPTPAPASHSQPGSAPPRLHNDEEDDDGPTMLGPRAGANAEALGDSDMPPRGVFDQDAETMALDEGRLPDLAPRDEEIDEATKVGAQAKELRRLQDAHVVVGQGARGDEATLAIPPTTDLGPLPDPSTLGPPLPPQTPQPAPVQLHTAPPPPHQAPPPRFAAPGPPVNPLEQTQMAGWQTNTAPTAWQASVIPQSAPQNAPYQAPIPPSQPFAPANWNQPAPQLSAVPNPPNPPLPLNSPAPEASGGFKVTPQVMLLAGVGVVCLAIFIIGIVLFVTTKF